MEKGSKPEFRLRLDPNGGGIAMHRRTHREPPLAVIAPNRYAAIVEHVQTHGIQANLSLPGDDEPISLHETIWKLWQAGAGSQHAIGDLVGVSHTTVGNVVRKILGQKQGE